MGRSYQFLSLVSATVVTTLGWVATPGSGWVYAQDKPEAKAAKPELTVTTTVEPPTIEPTIVESSTKPDLAETLSDPNIEVGDLALLAKPLTLTQLQHEADGWFQLLQSKVQKVSEEEVVIRREKRAIDARKIALEKIEAAKVGLENVEATRSGADPGTPGHRAFLQKVVDARTTLREAEIAVEIALRAEEKVTANSSFQAALEAAQQEQSIVRIQEVLKTAQAFVAKLPVDSPVDSAGSPSIPDEPSSPDQTSNPDKTSSSKKPSLSDQVEMLGDAVSTFEVLKKRLKEISPNSPDHAKIREKMNQAQTRSRTLALAIVKQVPELADDVVIAEIEASEQEAFGLAEAAKSKLQETNSILEKIDAQLNNEGLDTTTAQNANQQLEAALQDLQKTILQEADLKNQIVVDATKVRSEQVAIVDRLEAILDELDAKGGDSSTYRQYIQAVSGIEIDVTDTTSLGIRLMSWVQSEEGGVRWRRNVLKFVSVAAAFTLLSYLLSLVIRFSLRRFTHSSSFLQELAVVTVQRGGFIVGILIALTALEVSLTPLLAVLGGGSFVLAFALQSNLSNIASGLMMMWHKPFDIDDHVRIAGIIGYVKEITLTNTVIRTIECDTYVMPNELVWSNVIMNSTTEGRIRRDIPTQVDFDVDVQQVESLLLEIAASHPNVLEEPKPTTQVRFAESYVIIRLRPWMRPQDYDRLPTDLHRMITERFQQEGIAIAIPAQSVRYGREGDANDLAMAIKTLSVPHQQ